MRKFLSLMLALILALSMVAVNALADYERAEDEDIYYEVLGDYDELMQAAKAAETNDERFVLYAQAEAYLLDSAVMQPNTTRGGAYTISRIAPRTIPYVQWGNDDDRLFGLVISDEFITKEERAELMDAWNKAVLGEAEYDPAAILESHGHTIKQDYRTTFATAPVTLDWLNTSSASDTEITVNTVDGLVQYNNLNQLKPALAESWEISEDGTVYTFHIRQGVKWYTSAGEEYAEVTAKDFVAGFHHMLDAAAGLEWLVEGVVAGASEYLAGGSFDEVGYEATDDYTLVVTLEGDIPYFMTMLTYSCFLPICEDWYLSHGGVYGIEEYQEASADTATYTFGKNTDVASQVYCGPFLIQKLNTASEIYLVKNPNYYKADEVTLNSITWIYDNGENMPQYYADTVSGIYSAVALREANGTMKLALDDGNFEKYAYVTDTESVTYFGGLNVNRGTFALANGNVASPKTEQQKIDTHTALMNKNFRKAFLFAFDQATYNAVSAGDELKLASLRNMYTHPQFVSLENDTTDAEGYTFPAGTFYGDMVQYYLSKIEAADGVAEEDYIIVADACNGWYNAEKAQAYLARAKEELGDSVTYPITIDINYYSPNATQTAQINAVKQVIEAALGAENVVINMIEATTSEDFYASGYRASSGAAGNFDFFYGSGWGPDYGDPSTYLDTFGVNGYMLKVIGVDY